MDIYKKLHNDIKDSVDFWYWERNTKPKQDELIKQIEWFFKPKCIFCNIPLEYKNWNGENILYIRQHCLCLGCANSMNDFDEEVVYSSDEDFFDYESDDTELSIDSLISVKTI